MASQIAGLYDMEETLGSGHFAVVKSARHVFTGLRVAVKVIDKTKLDEVSKAHLYQEVRCMKLVTHPSIIRLYEVIDTQTKLYLIQELGDGGDLYDFIMKHPNGIEEGLARRIFKQTVSAIHYCHKLHVVHRDLKPENLVFCTGGKGPMIKLTDFGLSRTFLPGELIESSCGSLEYSAPEILLGDSYDPPKIDVWSLGVILFMLITGRSPFAYGGASETLTHIMDGRYLVPVHVTDPCKALISTMLVVDPLRRASLDQVMHNPWLVEGHEEDDHQSVYPLLPTISSMDEMQEEEIEVILNRLEQGGYGSPEDILRSIAEVPYGSTAATFFLLAEAERHRQLSRPPTTPSRQRKVSMPIFTPPNYFTNGPLSHASPVGHTPKYVPSPSRPRGSAETGVLQPRRFTAPSHPFAVPSPRTLNSPFTHSHVPPKLHLIPDTSDIPQYLRGSMDPHNSPYCSPHKPYPVYASPRVGVGGEQLSLGHSPKPAFPLNIQAMVAEEPPPVAPNVDHTFRPMRQLSTFEEESETESIPDMSRRSASPHNSPLLSPRSRRLVMARSSPNIFTSFSKSDASDEEEEDDDDIVELITSSGRFPNKGSTFPRLSPGSSPLLTSRRSPTTTSWTGSSDDELSGILETTRKHRNKRLSYKRRSIPPKLSRVDSLGSDDGVGQADRRRVRKNRENFIGMRAYNSVPATPVELTASESLTELIDNIRSQRDRSGSTRTDSSLSDGGPSGGDMSELANSMISRFELSDEEGSMDTDCDQRERTTTLRSVFCKIL